MIHPESNPSHVLYRAKCKGCEMEVDIIPNPQPNEAQIAGEAVALDCTNPRKCSGCVCTPSKYVHPFFDPEKPGEALVNS